MSRRLRIDDVRQGPHTSVKFGHQRALRTSARGIADGLPLDWSSLDAMASTESERGVLRQLALLARIAAVHRAPDEVSVGTAGASVWDTVDESEHVSASVDLGDGLNPRWGSLILLERLGQGSFGEVFRAWDTRLEREVALKLLREGGSDRPTSGSMVIKEARLLARVRHPNIVTIFGADEIAGRIGLWMECVRGRTLEHALLQSGPYSPQEATAAGLAICRALSAIHSAGLVHRDVKAQNVMRDEAGRIVLMDFGAGYDLTGDASDGGILGTPLYLPPEALRREPMTAQSDLYSLGVLLFHLVTGKYPVDGTSLENLAKSHREGQRTYLRDVRPDLPPLFVDVVEQALSTDPAKRFNTAGSMERALVNALIEESALGERIADAIRPTVPPPKPTRAAWRLTGGALAVCAFAGLILQDHLTKRASGSAPATGSPASTSSGPVMRQVQGMQRPSFVGCPSASGHIPFFDVNGDLAVRTPTGEIQVLTQKGTIDESGELAAAASNDGRRVAYTWRTLDNQYETRLITVDGKWPRVLLKDPALGIAMPLQWSNDNERIFSLIERPDRTTQLALIEAASGAVTLLKNLGHRRPLFASLSPDGQHIAFDHPQGAHTASRDIAVIATSDESSEMAIVSHPSNDMFPMWTGDGSGLLFFSDRTASLSAWVLPFGNGRPAGEPRLLDKAFGRLVPIGIDGAGTLFFWKDIDLSDAYLGTFTPDGVTNARVIAPDFVGESASSGFSPDGNHVAWISTRGVVAHDRFSRALMIRDLRDQTESELRPSLIFFNRLIWSPDSRRILVRGTDFEHRTGWHVVDVLTARTEPALVGSDDVIGHAVWSANGSSIIYGRSNNAIVLHDLGSGHEQVLVDVSAEGLLGRGLSQTFGLSPDGRALAYRLTTSPKGVPGQPGDSTLRVKVLGGESRDVLSVDSKEGIIFQDWADDGRQLLITRFARADRWTRTLWIVPLDGTKPRSAGLTHPELRDVQVRPGGTMLTFSAGTGRSELWQINNFVQR